MVLLLITKAKKGMKRGTEGFRERSKERKERETSKKKERS